jgi:hypothetical protein
MAQYLNRKTGAGSCQREETGNNVSTMVHLQIGIPSGQFRNITQVTACRNIFTSQVCQEFINARKKSDSSMGALPDKEKGHFKYLDLKFLNQKIVDILKTLVVNVNTSAYGFDISDIVAGYILKNEPGNFSEWYEDFAEDEFTTTRKLTALLFLTGSKDYQGGGLSFLVGNQDATYEQGTVIIFPSYHLYKFEPVIKGSQQVFVYWACGQAFH